MLRYSFYAVNHKSGKGMANHTIGLTFSYTF